MRNRTDLVKTLRKLCNMGVISEHRMTEILAKLAFTDSSERYYESFAII